MWLWSQDSWVPVPPAWLPPSWEAVGKAAPRSQTAASASALLQVLFQGLLSDWQLVPWAMTAHLSGELLPKMLFLLVGGPFEHNLAIPFCCMSPSVIGLPAGRLPSLSASPQPIDPVQCGTVL